MDFSAIRDKCVEYSVEAPKMAASVFKLAVHGSNAVDEQQDYDRVWTGYTVPFGRPKHRDSCSSVKYHRSQRSWSQCNPE